MSDLVPPQASDQRAYRRVLLLVIVGLAVGALTSVGQTYLHGALMPLVNSAAAWLVAPFLVGSRMISLRGAAAAGVGVCVLQLLGYTATSELRGFATGNSVLVFWTTCAAVGGPVFGSAGWLWRTRSHRLHGLGAAVLPAAFLAEGLWTYAYVLNYHEAATLWIAIGAALALALPRGRRERPWLALTVPAGLLGQIALTQIYTQSF